MNERVDPNTIGGGLPASISRRLRAELGESVFISWFGRLALDEVVDGTAQLSVPTKFLKSWILEHYQERLLKVFVAEMPEVRAIALVIRSSASMALRQVPALSLVASNPIASTPSSAPVRPTPVLKRVEPAPAPDPLPSSALDRRLTFASFRTGRCNHLAYGAALNVARREAVEPLRYNPFFVHGQVGLGKTHLLQAIAHEATERGRRVVYLTAEKFMYGFVLALRAQTMLAFQERLRDVDMLLVDDAQFLQGKSIRQEFCNTVNAMLSAEKQIVVAADRPPHELEHLDDRVRSRLAGGLTVEITSLDAEVRLGILRSRVEATRALMPDFVVPEPVLERVAALIQTNGRDLDGAVNRLMAHASLTQTALTIASAEDAIRDLVRQREPKRVKIEDIQKLVATHYGFGRTDILSARRTANVVRPRQVAMYLSKVLTLRSLPEIGRRFGGRDHTTILSGVRKIERLLTSDNDLKETVTRLRLLLEEE